MRKYGRIDDDGELRVLCGSNCSNSELRKTLAQSRGRAGPIVVMGGRRGVDPARALALSSGRVDRGQACGNDAQH